MLYDSMFLIHLAGQRGRVSQIAARRFLDAWPDDPVPQGAGMMLQLLAREREQGGSGDEGGVGF
jgi:hypothetical protein